MLRPSSAAVWGSFSLSGFMLQNNSALIHNNSHRKTTPYLLSGWDAVQPNLLANSFSDRSRWTSRPPRPFPSSFPPLSSTLQRPPNLFSPHVGATSSQIQCIFLQRRQFSLRLQSFSLRLAPSSSAPDVGKFVCLCRQLAEYSLSALQVSSPSVAFMQTKSSYTTVPNLFQLLK